MKQNCTAAIAYSPDLLLYDFGPQHPLRPERITAGLDLLETAGLWSREMEAILPVESNAVDLELVHDSAYIRAVDEGGGGYYPSGMLARFGFSSADNPPFSGMHHAAALVTGATVEAARCVMDGSLHHAFSPAGGLHHALRARASGFCIYNDPAIAAAILVRDCGARVFYVDFDCHHGDGVQWIFYNDPRVMTVSLHESGRFLFPGTGEVSEVGEGDGSGYSINVPFAPYTRDDAWQDAVERVVPALVERFKPDVIISNHGCDTHAWDPITHLALSTDSFVRQAELMHDLAHGFCQGRLVAVGSGGYDWKRVVPRSWSIVWCALTGRALPERLPAEWLARWSGDEDERMPLTFLDDPSIAAGPPLHADIARVNRETLKAVLEVTGLGHSATSRSR